MASGTLEERLRHLLATVEAAPAWRGKPFREYFAHHTRGLGRRDQGAVALLALEVVERWGADGALDARPAEELARLPPLYDHIAWAAYRIAAIVTDRLDAAEKAGDKAAPPALVTH